jgi:hypothetical protein
MQRTIHSSSWNCEHDHDWRFIRIAHDPRSIGTLMELNQIRRVSPVCRVNKRVFPVDTRWTCVTFES